MKCPRCNCALAKVLQESRWLRGSVQQQRQCVYCGVCYWAPKPEEAGQGSEGSAQDAGSGVGVQGSEGGHDADVIYSFRTAVRCPHCGQVGGGVTSTRKRVRYHRCTHCGRSFKEAGTQV